MLPWHNKHYKLALANVLIRGNDYARCITIKATLTEVFTCTNIKKDKSFFCDNDSVDKERTKMTKVSKYSRSISLVCYIV